MKLAGGLNRTEEIFDSNMPEGSLGSPWGTGEFICIYRMFYRSYIWWCRVIGKMGTTESTSSVACASVCCHNVSNIVVGAGESTIQKFDRSEVTGVEVDVTFQHYFSFLITQTHICPLLWPKRSATPRELSCSGSLVVTQA